MGSSKTTLNPTGLSSRAFATIESRMIKMESQASQLNPTFIALQGASATQRTRHARAAIDEAKTALGDLTGQNARDLNAQIRSEIGQDGNETYFENYVGTVYCGPVNFFVNQNGTLDAFVLGSTSGEGTLGSSKLTYLSVITRIDEFKPIQDLDEKFDSTTYQDSLTSATGWGSGLLSFSRSPASTTGSNVLALLRFDGTVNDDMGNYPGSYFSGSPTYDTSGAFGSCFFFDTTGGDQFSIPIVGLGSEGTISFWFKPQTEFSNTSGSATTQTIVSLYENELDHLFIGLSGADSSLSDSLVGSLICEFGDSNGSAILYSKTISRWEADKWYHAGFTYKNYAIGSTWSGSLWVNGSAHTQDEIVSGASYSIIGSIVLGSNQVGSHNISGGAGWMSGMCIDEFCFQGSQSSDIIDTVNTSGSYALFSSWKSGSFEQTSFNRIRIDPVFERYNPNVQFRASFNGGSTYTVIEPLIEKSISPVGSDFRLDITDTTGSVVIKDIYVTTKGERF